MKERIVVDWKGVSDVEDLKAVVIEALTDAHDNLAQAQIVSRQQGEGVYGQIWRSLCDDLVARVSKDRLEVQVIKPARFPYKLPVVGNKILFPWRPAGGHTPTSIAFGTSPTRRGLWKQSLPPEFLPLQMADVEGGDVESDAPAGEQEGDIPAAVMTAVTDVVAEAERQHLRVVIVAMTSDARRLRTIEWGEAELGADKVLQWAEGSLETLYEISDAPAPASTSPQTFADGPAPTPHVTLKPMSQPKTANGNTDSTGPGTESGAVEK